MSRAAGSPEPAATDPRRKGGRSSGQKGGGMVLPPKAGLKLGLPRTGSSPHNAQGSGGSRDRWGRNVIQAQPRVCRDKCRTVCGLGRAGC